MDITYRLDGVDIGDRVKFGGEGTGFITAAERGAVAIGGVIIENPLGDLDIDAWQEFTVEDADATPTRVYTGYVGPRAHNRQNRLAPVGVKRVHDTDLYDLNTLLAMDVLHTNAAKRIGVESDVTRITYLLGSEVMSGLIFDEGLFSTSNPINFLEADLRGSTAYDAIAEMAPIAGKNFFVTRDVSSGNPSFYYNTDTSVGYASTCRISNVLGDADSDTFLPMKDTEAVLDRSPENKYGALWLEWAGDPIYVRSASTIASMGGLIKAVKVSTNRIGRVATAQSFAVEALNKKADEEDTITVNIRVPSAKVNAIVEGHRLEVKFTNLPGFEAFRWTRVRRKHIIPDSEGMWRMQLQLFVIGVPTDDAEPPSAPCDDNLSLAGTVTAAGDQGTDASPDAALQPLNPTLTNDGDDESYSERIAIVAGVTGEARTYRSHWIIDLGSALAVESMIALDHTSLSGADLTHVWYSTTGAAGSWTDASATITRVTGTGWLISFATQTKRYWRVSVEQSGFGLFYIPPLAIQEWRVFGCEAAETPLPGTGDHVNDGSSDPAFGDGSTTTFTTGAYKDNSLIVLLDGIDIWADVTESDPETGEYELAFAPDVAERLLTRYESR